MKQYLELIEHVLKYGQNRTDRTGTGTISVFNYQALYDLRDGFPLVTTAEKDFDNIKGETLWFLEGSTNAKYLAEKYGFKIWRKWQKDESGDLGRVYGAQWRGFRGIKTCTLKDIHGNIARVTPYTASVDQINYLLNEIHTNPYSRRMVLSSWNPVELYDMALPPCHWSFELYIDGENMDTLNLKLHQRSCDVFLGVPYNIAGYALLLEMFAHVTGLRAGLLVHDMTNVHIYNNHIDQCIEQLSREPKPLPKLILNPEIRTMDGFTMDDIQLEGYDPHPPIKGKVSV